MSSAGLPWFRMYADFLNDPKMIALAFEDQRHFIAVLALKCSGVLDQACAPELLDRIVAQRLWIDHAMIREVKRRLVAAGLVDEDWQPIKWGDRQMRSDADPSNAERQRRYRANHRNATRNVTVTGLDTDTDTEKEEEKKGKGAARAQRPVSATTLTTDALVAEGVDPQVAKDWLTLRKARRLPLTQTAWDAVKAEAAQANMPVADAVRTAVVNCWGGFKAAWLARLGGEKVATGAPRMGRQEALEAKNLDVAERWAQGGDDAAP